MSDKKNMQISDDALDSVAGGMTGVDLSGSTVGRDQTILDESFTQIKGSEVTYGSKSVDIGDKIDVGDKIGGNKTDVDVDAKIETQVKRSLF